MSYLEHVSELKVSSARVYFSYVADVVTNLSPQLYGTSPWNALLKDKLENSFQNAAICLPHRNLRRWCACRSVILIDACPNKSLSEVSDSKTSQTEQSRYPAYH
jgi:hypothetical protein